MSAIEKINNPPQELLLFTHWLSNFSLEGLSANECEDVIVVDKREALDAVETDAHEAYWSQFRMYAKDLDENISFLSYEDREPASCDVYFDLIDLIDEKIDEVVEAFEDKASGRLYLRVKVPLRQYAKCLSYGAPPTEAYSRWIQLIMQGFAPVMQNREGGYIVFRA